jgi:hypothetical protein
MAKDVKQFFAGAFALIALFLLLANSGGFAKDISAATTGSSTVFATLQGRAT